MAEHAADPFGMALLEAFEGGLGHHEIERDDGYRDSMDATMYFDAAADWPAATGEVLEQLHGRVLDVGCGAGRHAILLRAAGCEVIGLDPSPGAVEVCRRRGLDARLGSLGVEGLLADERFDAVVMLGNNLGLLASPERAAEHLDWLAARCRPGALLVGESMDVTKTETPVHLAYHRRATAAGRPPGQMRLRVRFADQVGDWFSYWHLSPEELRSVVRNTSWRIDRTIGEVEYVAVLQRD